MSQENLRRAVRAGLLAGLVAVCVSAIGMVETFDERDIITGVLTLGQVLLYSAPLIGSYLGVDPGKGVKIGAAVIFGLVTGLITAIPLIALIYLTILFPGIRDNLVNVSASLIEILTFGQGPVTGSLILTLVFSVLGILGALFHQLPAKVERPLISGLIWTIGIGLFSEILINILRPLAPRDILNLLFGSEGITPITAAFVFVLALAFTAWWEARGSAAFQARRVSMAEEQNERSQRSQSIVRLLVILGITIILILLPWILGKYLSEILAIVGIFVIMGLGLNIVVGYAGLLDLGYVAFFAIGAYTMGLLTSSGDLGVAGMPFWAALPIAVLAATTAGIILGVPVLRMRGDYLAIVTLGFGEIIRVLAASDLLKSFIGGAQGILKIGKPQILSFTFVEPQHFYYLILAGALLAAFVSWRLRDARIGRQWMALREDEDVAEAMGIRLVNTKLMAFAIGAAFSGLAGAIFASRIGSIFPHSFNLLISINVLCLIIVGGLGSLPGVVLGAFVLVGLPELLREFAEYRLLLYGALLIATMLLRPEGLWPSPIRKRELHALDEEAVHEGPDHAEIHPLV